MNWLLLTILFPVTLHCGYERWAVKTGQDAGSRLKPVVATTIAALAHLRSPLPKQTGKYPPQINRRLTHEDEPVTITGTITAYRVENDSDIHLVVSNGKESLIAEIPNPGCMDNLAGHKGMGPSPWIAQVTAVRAAFLLKTGYTPTPWSSAFGPQFVKADIPVTLTGVTFFDWPHAQHGAARNAVEIHPVLEIAFP
ncbi:MAG: hypothetical protein M3Y86_11535 [Verrucomicrobiota bacterium]|nr:hypothetical protein [Verrucomicrobiota bacterium]